MDSNTLQVDSCESHIAKNYSLLQTKAQTKNFKEHPVASIVLQNEVSDVVFIKGHSIRKVQALFRIDNKGDFLSLDAQI